MRRIPPAMHRCARAETASSPPRTSCTLTYLLTVIRLSPFSSRSPERHVSVQLGQVAAGADAGSSVPSLLLSRAR
eukprot:6024958-Pleurochrysis_carterae.AAC.1